VTFPVRTTYALAAVLLLITGLAYAQGPGDPKAVSSKDGEYFDKNGNPTFHIVNGKVDWYTNAGLFVTVPTV
jgi:hypothetical protein